MRKSNPVQATLYHHGKKWRINCFLVKILCTHENSTLAHLQRREFQSMQLSELSGKCHKAHAQITEENVQKTKTQFFKNCPSTVIIKKTLDKTKNNFLHITVANTSKMIIFCSCTDVENKNCWSMNW